MTPGLLLALTFAAVAALYVYGEVVLRRRHNSRTRARMVHGIDGCRLLAHALNLGQPSEDDMKRVSRAAYDRECRAYALRQSPRDTNELTSV